MDLVGDLSIERLVLPLVFVLPAFRDAGRVDRGQIRRQPSLPGTEIAVAREVPPLMRIFSMIVQLFAAVAIAGIAESIVPERMTALSVCGQHGPAAIRPHSAQ